MQLASILGGDDLVMKPLQRQPVQHLQKEKGFMDRVGQRGEGLAMDALASYATGAGATANPYAAGMMLGARALFGSDGTQVPAQGGNPVASAIMDRAELMETENALINDYENIKKYLSGGGQVKYYQEGTPAPVAPVQREMLPPSDGRYSYEYPTLGDANEDMGPQINPWNQEEPPVDTTRVPDFVKHPSTDNLIGYQTLGDANEDMGPQINPWEGSSVKPVSDGGMYEKQSKAYSPKEFSDMINRYLGS